MRVKTEVGYRHSGRWIDQDGQPCDPPRYPVSVVFPKTGQSKATDADGCEIVTAPLRPCDRGMPVVSIFETYISETLPGPPVEITSRAMRNAVHRAAGVRVLETGERMEGRNGSSYPKPASKVSIADERRDNDRKKDHYGKRIVGDREFLEQKQGTDG